MDALFCDVGWHLQSSVASLVGLRCVRIIATAVSCRPSAFRESPLTRSVQAWFVVFYLSHSASHETKRSSRNARAALARMFNALPPPRPPLPVAVHQVRGHHHEQLPLLLVLALLPVLHVVGLSTTSKFFQQKDTVDPYIVDNISRQRQVLRAAEGRRGGNWDGKRLVFSSARTRASAWG